MTPIEAIRANVRALGWFNGLAYVLATGLERVSGGRVRLVKYDLVAQPVSTEPLLPAHRGRTIQIYEARPDDPL
ncbi:MAG TPA: hypothetical protein VLN90_00080, partial [Thioalkalivibrio sp.]|nr:hypothetical protein [Thioalkalivibrio sp.]